MHDNNTRIMNRVALQSPLEHLSIGRSVPPPPDSAPAPAANPKLSSAWLGLGDAVLAALAFFGVHFARAGNFAPTETYAGLLSLYALAIFTMALLFNKYGVIARAGYAKVLYLNAKCALLSLYFVVMLIVFLGWTAISRLQVIGSFALLFLLEAAAATVYYVARHRRLPGRTKRSGLHLGRWFDISLFRLCNEFLLITLSFFIINYVRTGGFTLTPRYEKILLAIYGVWLVSSLFTRTFDIGNVRSLFYFVAPYVKAFFLMTALMALLVFAFRLSYYSRLHLFGTFLLFTTLQTVYNALYFLDRLAYDQRNAARRRKSLHCLAGNGKSEAAPAPAHCSERSHALAASLRQALNQPELRDCLDFVERQPLLARLQAEDVQLFHAAQVPAWNGSAAAAKLFINTWRVNDIRHINKHFLALHRQIEFGAYCLGRFETLEVYKQRFFKKYPPRFARYFYYINFIFTRIFPKLPYINKVYFILTRGKNRVLSTAEVLGRLCYCGFRVIDFKDINGDTYYLAQKAGTPSTDKTPSYGPLIKIDKIGLDGKIIHLRKIRTMHPYSEYLQEFVHQRNNLAANGKFNEDFRVAEYGEFFRKYWIDEMPQLLNFFRGDIGLVGVRAISAHYFSLYPKDVQRLRIKFKPGLVPPYYADLPRSFEEIVASEKRYLEQKLAKPFTTDIIYLYRALYNVLFKKAHSQ